MLDKAALRLELRARRAAAFKAQRNAGERLIAHFPADVLVDSNSIVAAYMPIRSEIDPLPLARQLSLKGANIAMPRVPFLTCEAGAIAFETIFGISPRPTKWGEGLGVRGDWETRHIRPTFARRKHPLTQPSPPEGERASLSVYADPPAAQGSTSLEFHLCNPDNLSHFEQNKWGILEPRSDRPKVTPNILLVPLLGFDAQCNRIGYGKGHYDNAIIALKQQGPLTTIGLAFAVQEVLEIPTQPHDQRLDWIITENGAYRSPS